MCDYKCYETKESREQRRHGSLSCEDSRVPSYYEENNRKPFCKSCKDSYDDGHLWKEQDVIGNPFDKCSKSSCLIGVQDLYEKAKKKCKKTKDPRLKKACKLGAFVAKQVALAACDMCKNK